MTLYDEKISQDISIGTVIDAMFIDDDSPEEIANVLKMYSPKEIVIISRDCDRWNRIFQIDFVLQLSLASQDFILSLLTCIPVKLAAYLVWQIFSTAADIHDMHLKSTAKQILSKVLNQTELQHPYRHSLASNISQFDNLLFAASRNNDIASIAEKLDSQMLHEALYFATRHSLFYYRILQDDFFTALSDANKWIMIQEICNDLDDVVYSYVANGRIDTHAIDVFKFFKQIMTSTEIDNAVKQTLFSKAKAAISTYLYPKYVNPSRDSISTMMFKLFADKDKDYAAALSKSTTYSELCLTSLVYGKPLTSNVVAVLMLLDDLNILREWNKANPDELKSLFDISCILDSA